MSSYMTINVDFIGIVRKSGDGFIYEELQIPRSHQETMERLKSMVEDDKMTACEMSVFFDAGFPIKNDFNYCYPNNYWDVNYGPSAGAYPEFTSRDDYQKVLDLEESKLREELTSDGKKTRDEIEAEVDKHIKRLIAVAKEGFYARCEYYLNAFDYSSLRKQINHDHSVKMYSTEVIGEYAPTSTMTFSLTSDISFSLHTNFRFGNSSCFFLKMCYKGVQLLFYSDYVKYFYANAVDIVRYTKHFDPLRENWPTALKFVAEYSTKANQTPGRFEEEFINGQVSILVNGLRDIMEGRVSVKSHIDNMTKFAQESKYIGLRTISGSDRAAFKVYPEEMDLIFKSEKITGALDLLESMKDFSSITSVVEGAISEIQVMNRTIAPRLEGSIREVESALDRLNRRIEYLTAEENRLTSLIEPYWAERAAFLEKVDRTICPEPLKKFEEDHPEYVKLSKDKESISAERVKLSQERTFRTSYRDRLQHCLDKVNASGLI